MMSKGLFEMGSIFPPYFPTTLGLSATFGEEILGPHFAENSVCLSSQSRLVANGSVRGQEKKNEAKERATNLVAP